MILILVGCQWQLKIERFRQLKIERFRQVKIERFWQVKIEHFVDDAECDSYARLGRDPGPVQAKTKRLGEKVAMCSDWKQQIR